MITTTNINENQVGFKLAMRRLWEDHIIWTRQVIVSAAAGLPDLGFAVDRLMQNQVDIGNTVKPFYGNAGGERLIALLKEHISGAYEVLLAAKVGDNEKLQSASKGWYKNADEIAIFLSNANPEYWDVGHMKAHMNDHLDLTLAEAVNRLHGKWVEDIAAYDKVHVQILKMADMLADGIISQFPKKF
ncbi:MAG: hypothetical protein PHE50_06605 [Dehalococcoidales bacterium]|nr:hypothetical protein [Dehalococcoidales bacterium]